MSAPVITPEMGMAAIRVLFPGERLNDHMILKVGAALQAAIAAAPPACARAGDGKTLNVPRDATPEMLRAAVVYANGNAVYKNVAAEALAIEESIYGEVWAAMLAAAPAVPPPAWQPIETAPKDGSEVLLLQDGMRAAGMFYSEADGGPCWWGTCANGVVLMNPSHWQRLPATRIQAPATAPAKGS